MWIGHATSFKKMKYTRAYTEINIEGLHLFVGPLMTPAKVHEWLNFKILKFHELFFMKSTKFFFVFVLQCIQRLNDWNRRCAWSALKVYCILCMSVCLYPVNVKTSKPIKLNFFWATRMFLAWLKSSKLCRFVMNIV